MPDNPTPEDTVSPLYLAQQFAEVARRLSSVEGEAATFEAIVQAALTAVPGAQAAGLTIMRGEQFRTVAPSEEIVEQVDAIQYELRSGPCVDAILAETIFRTGDLGHDQRWPNFGKRAVVECGVHSMIGLRLFLGDIDSTDETVASLNLYSREPDAFDENAAVTGSIFATHAALAAATARVHEQAANLRRSQESNREIGMAMGVLMSRHALTQDQAFDLLRMASQHTHRKLRDIAADVVQTGMLDFPPTAKESTKSNSRIVE
ncbi:MAG TPA: GAF and ANTAR domain-containing protein [Jatrophihabitans sp.]|nr:GAF and ANTAR domain-containing protein [Jatrophihabitans sp.]